MLPTIALCFGPEFPGLAGQRHSLTASKERPGRVVAWTIGRLKHCDFRSTGTTISRVHCTIYYDRSFQHWYLVDGGEYPDGDPSFSPSHNGVFLDGSKIPPGNPESLEVGSKILLGPDLRHKIVVAATVDDTFSRDPWDSEGWPEVRKKDEPPAISTEVRKELHQQAIKKQPHPNTIPGAIAYCADVLRESSLLRVLVYGVIGLAIVALIVAAS